MVGEGGADMRERIRSEERKGRTDTRRQCWGGGGVQRAEDEAQNQLKAGNVELDDASLLELVVESLVVVG